MKERVKDYKNCIKADKVVNYKPIIPEKGLEGVIVYSESEENKPEWCDFINSFCAEEIPFKKNTSNKAILFVTINNRIMALTFGYGKSLLKDECIEKNFGLITALNMMDEEKIKSVNAATIEDMIVNTEMQSSRATGQDEFSLNHFNDIMTSITGKGKDEEWARTVSGKDSLIVSVEMVPSELSGKLERYLKEYESKTYKVNFPWIENVKEERDKVKIRELNDNLYDKIINNDYEGLFITPPEVIDWEMAQGFMITGDGKRKTNKTNYSFEIEFEEYLDAFEDEEKNLEKKLKRDRLIMLDREDSPHDICSIYNALVAQVKLCESMYVLYSGKWYKVKEDFYDEIMNYIAQIPDAKINLPHALKNEKEGEYNCRVCENNKFCLMDKKLTGVENGVRKIEACDIFTKDKKFIHVKKRESSSQLSHLFAQGKVSIDCFYNDKEFRRQVYDLVKDKFGENIFDYEKKPGIDEFELVFAIIAKKKVLKLKELPFFSLVNLMMTMKELEKMHVKASVAMIEQEE